MTIEYRSFTAESVEATDEGHIFGLAIPYNRVTTIGSMEHGGFRESIAPGACNKSLREADIVALNNHNSWQPLGRTSAGNLTLKSATRGIEPDLVPIDTSYGQDLVKNVKAGITRGWSFGFEVIKDEWTADGEPSDEWSGTDRTIREMKLVEVSPVTFPAYEMTTIGTRSAVLEAREAVFDIDCRGGDAPGDGSKPYGNVTYADPGYQDGKKRYPLDSKKHAQAAWAYINVAANASAYTAEQLASVKGRIKAALKKFGVDVSDDDKKAESDDGTEKRISQISALLSQALKLLDHESAPEPADPVSDNDADERSAEPKPDEESTSADHPDETALPTDDDIRAAIAAMRSREVELGL